MGTSSKGYRAILPAPVEQDKTPDSSEPGSAGEGRNRSSKRRRVWKGAGRSACHLCRLRKTAVSLPACPASPRCCSPIRVNAPGPPLMLKPPPFSVMAPSLGVLPVSVGPRPASIQSQKMARPAETARAIRPLAL